MRIWPFGRNKQIKTEEKTAVLKISDHEPWRSWWGTESGQIVTAETALNVTTVLSALRVIAEDVAKLPCVLKLQNADGTKSKLIGTPLYALIYSRPNSWMTAFQWKETMTLHAGLVGNGYSFISRDSRSRPMELIPLMPHWVEVSTENGLNKPAYSINDQNGSKLENVTRENIFHLAGPSWNGTKGMEAVKQAREAIGLAISAEKSQSKLHNNASRLSGILTTDQVLSREVLENLKKSWTEQHQGVDNAYKTAILDGGIKFQSTTMTSTDAQHLETRQFQIEEICRGIKIFPQMVGHTDKTATFASAEAFFRAHFEHTIWPWLVRWEQTLDRDLLDREGPLFYEFDVSRFGRSALKDRAQYYRTLTEMGIMTRNEARIEEGRDPLPGLDEPLTPLNMARGEGNA